MKLNFKQEQFLDFVKDEHGDQVRKYTGEPYWYHVFEVAKIVSKYEDGAIEIALGHDLLEDTNCTESKLESQLLSLGYDLLNTDFIVQGIIDLTDVYTPEDFPDLNRANRKAFEAERLSSINPLSQSIKYADLIHNSQSIAKYDPGFAKIYFKEKRMILSGMRDGNQELLKYCEKIINNAEIGLNK